MVRTAFAGFAFFEYTLFVALGVSSRFILLTLDMSKVVGVAVTFFFFFVSISILENETCEHDVCFGVGFSIESFQSVNLKAML